MACGLPVVYRDSGGNSELAGEFGVPLTDDLPSVIDSLRRKLPRLRRKLIENKHRFLIERAAKQYVSVFRGVISKPHASR